MSISSLSAIGSSTQSFLKQLESDGLSADKAKLVDTDLTQALQDASGSGSSSASISSASVRAALDSKIASDVSSGKLSASDAATVKKTLDDMDKDAGGSGITLQSSTSTDASRQTSAPAASGAQGSGGGGSGGGGSGGGGSSATEVSESVTVSGSTKTTVVTYSDNTTSTTTTTASDADKLRYAKPSAQTDTAATNYLATIETGSLIDVTA